MRNSTRRALRTALLAWLVLCSAPASAGPVDRPLPAAQADSLVWYVEQLEHDLTICHIRAGARADSLALRLEYVTQQLQWAQEDRRRWYQDPRLWFLAGAAASVLVMSSALHLSF